MSEETKAKGLLIIVGVVTLIGLIVIKLNF
jgi:hypothetical protein